MTTYRRRLAPPGLMTRRQLRAAGLRPNGRDPVAQIRYWRRGWQHAYLYDTATAAPKRPMTPGRWRSIDAMNRARRICPGCRKDCGYVYRRSLGTCEPCNGRTA